MTSNKNPFSWPILLACIIYSLLSSACSNNKNAENQKFPHQEIDDLKAVVKAASTYEADYLARIDSIRHLYNKASSNEDRFNLALLLSEENRNFNTDSSIYYANKCSEFARFGSIIQQQRSDIAKVSALSTAGLFVQAFPLFNNLLKNNIDPSLKCELWLAGRTLSSYMISYVGDQSEYVAPYKKEYIAYDDSLLVNLPVDSHMRQFIEGERLVTDGRFDEARLKLENLLTRLPDNDNLYGMASFQLAEVYKNRGDENMYASYLAKAAISDIKGCVREGVALPTLAYWLYQRDDFNDAFNFINFSLEDAMKGRTRMRTVSIAKMVPVIDGAYRERMNNSRDEIMIYFLLASCLFVISVVLLSVLFRQMKRMRDNEKKIKNMSRRQEAYITNLVSLCSGYSDRLDSLSLTVSRKLTAGQSDDLLKLVNSGKFADNGNDEFFATFDTTFLSIYPDFIEGINLLLRPDEQFDIKDKNSLSPELRIYAFVRLGLEESTKIAQILHYSPSTVYAYRNRMRNKAINRDSFDQDVMNISK